MNSKWPFQKIHKSFTMRQKHHNSSYLDTSISISPRILETISHVSRKKMAPNNNRPKTLKTTVCKANSGLATWHSPLRNLRWFPRSNSNKNFRISTICTLSNHSMNNNIGRMSTVKKTQMRIKIMTMMSMAARLTQVPEAKDYLV